MVKLKRATMMAIIVGTLLIGINQYDVLLYGPWTPRLWIKVALTPVVPFSVSYISSYLSEREHKR